MIKTLDNYEATVRKLAVNIMHNYAVLNSVDLTIRYFFVEKKCKLKQRKCQISAADKYATEVHVASFKYEPSNGKNQQFA